uniref:Methyltransferase n=1 Tax=Streptomyces roseoverticillatus TaxID=66429 RepID=A0A0S3TVV1_9ACTN|nr:methyltransferase [Streptomyces roseoverticillatus]
MDQAQDFDRTFERFQLIANGPALFNAVTTALDFDLFRFLSDHPGSEFDAVQRFTEVPRHQLRVLLHALCATELVVKHDERYTNSEVAERLLASDAPESWRDTLLGWRRFQYPAFPHTTQALRTGTNTALSAYPGEGPTLYDRLSHDPETEAAYHASLGPFTHLFAPALLDHAELSSVGNLLDVAGGAGTIAKMFADRYPHATVTVFDMPSVTQLAAQSVPPHLAGRVRFHAGDLFQDTFPTGFDGVLFSHSLEVFSPEQNKTLLAKALDALAPGGKIFAYGTTAPDDERSGLLAARLSLFLNVLAAGSGMAYPAKDYCAWMLDIGCADVKAFTDLPYEHGLVVGTKGSS